MKVVRDLSVTSLNNSGMAVPWYSAWAAPLSGGDPQLVLDFAAGVYGAGGTRDSLDNTLSVARNSVATHIDDLGNIATVPAHSARIEHDANSLAPIGLLLEAASTNLIVQSDAPANQNVTVTASVHVLSFYGTGTVTATGAHTGSYTGSGAFPDRTTIVFTPAAGDLTLTFAGSVSYVQLEEGAVASSYISSGPSATTRDEDIATMPLGSWFDATQGTLVFSGTLNDAAANDRLVEIEAGDTSTRLSVLWNTVLGKPQFQVWDGGALQAAIAPSGASVALGEHFRVAIGFSANDFAVSLNGSPAALDVVGTMPVGLATLRLGRSIWGAQGLSLTESVVYYPSRLSDAEIQALSA